MKKTIVIFPVILVAVYIGLSMLDRGEYVVEKKLWRAEKSFAQIRQDPTVVPEQRFEDVAQQFLKIVRKHPDSRLAPQIYTKVAEVYATAKKFENARKVLSDIITRYPDEKNHQATAVFNKALTYEKEGRRRDAEDMYEKIISEYALTDLGMSIYIYIANSYQQTGDGEQGKMMLRRGVSFYKKTIVENPATELEFKAMRLLSTAYLALGQWSSAIDTLAETLDKTQYLSVPEGKFIVRSINTISIVQLQDYNRPIQLYENFLQNHPNHELTRFLQKIISDLKKLKSKNIVIAPQKNG